MDRSTSVTAAVHVCSDGHTYPRYGDAGNRSYPTDIFPNIDIPVVSIIWSYNGLVPEDMSYRVVSVTERALTTTVEISSTSNRSRCMELPLLRSFSSRMRTFNRVFHRLRRFLRPSSSSCPQERRGRSFLPIAHRVCLSSSWLSRGKICQSKN